MKTNLLILFLLLAATISLQAQQPRLAVLSKPGKTAVELR